MAANRFSYLSQDPGDSDGDDDNGGDSNGDGDNDGDNDGVNDGDNDLFWSKIVVFDEKPVPF